MRPLIVTYIFTVVISASTTSALLNVPFLDDLDSDTVCTAALHYRAPGQQPGDAASHTATSKEKAAILTSDSSYRPGHALNVTVSAADGVRGLMLQGRRKSSNIVVGQFVVENSRDTATFDCDGPDDTVVAWYGTQTGTGSRTFTWLPPDDGAVGQLEFVGTIFSDISHYWTDVTSDPLRKGFSPIDLSGCGKTKGCFRYTSKRGVTDCDSKTCDYVLTYRVLEGEIAQFEMSARAQWAGVGFSSDDRMGGEDVFVCLRLSSSHVDIRRYFTEPSNYVREKADENLRDKEWELTDNGYLSCRFRRDLKVKSDPDSVDLNNNWYQLYAWGDVAPSSDTLTRHTLEKPPTSSQKITVRSKRNELVSGATSVTWLPAHLSAIVLLQPAALYLLLEPFVAFIHF